LLRYCERREQCPVADFKLLKNVMEMHLDGPVGNIQPTPNFLVGQSYRYQTHDLALTVRQYRHYVLRKRNAFRRPGHYLIGGRLRQQPLAIRDLAQGLHQRFGRHILRNDTIGAGRGRYNQFAVINRCGEKDQPRGKTLGVGDAEDFQPGQAWLYTAAQQFPGTHL